MQYKTTFQPMERLGRDGWRRMDESGFGAKSERRLLELPIRGERRRHLLDA
jgi:arginine-tRNA-protein transferase